MAEAKELSLLNNVENRIVFAKSDDALEKTLHTYLCPLLLKLNSPHESARQKVVSICQHVNTRIKPAAIKLPVKALLAQFKTEGNSPLLQNLDLMYIQRGIERLSEEELAPLLPDIIRSMSRVSASHQKTIFHIFLRVLDRLSPPPNRGSHETYAAALTFEPGDVEFITSRITTLLLLSVSVFSVSADSRPSPLRCPGLTPAEFEFLTSGSKETISAADITGLKVKGLKFLIAAGIPDEMLFVPLVVASGSDSGSQLLELGEGLLKKLNVDVDNITMKRLAEGDTEIEVRNETMINNILRLYELYSGSPGDKLEAVKSTLQIKILNVFSRSLLAIDPAVVPPAIIRQVVEDGLLKDANQTNPKLHTAVFAYLGHVTRLGCDELLSDIGPGIVDTIRLWLVSQGWPRVNTLLSPAVISLRSRAYGVIGLFCKRQPRLVTADQFQLLRFMFSSFKENVEVRIAVEEAISTLVLSLGELSRSEKIELRELVLESLRDDKDGTGWGSYVKAANRGLEFGDLGRIWACLIVASSGRTSLQMRKDVIDAGEKGLDPYFYKISNPGPPHRSNTQSSQRLNDQMDVDDDTNTSDRFAFPTITALIEFLVSNNNKYIPLALIEANAAGRPAFSTGRKRVYRSEFAGVPEAMLPGIVTFIRRLVVVEACKPADSADSSESWISSVATEQDWEAKLSTMLTTSSETRSSVSEFLRANTEPVSVLCKSLLSGILHPNGPIQNCGEILKEFLPLLPRRNVLELAEIASEQGWSDLRDLSWSNRKADRDIGGYVLALVASEYKRSGMSVEGLVHSLLEKSRNWDTTWGTEANKIYGSLGTLPILVSRLMVVSPDCSEAVPMTEQTVQSVTEIYSSILLESRETTLIDLALEGMIQLFQFKFSRIAHLNREKLYDQLKKLAKDGNEKAILVLGSISLIYPSVLSDEESKELHELKEALFTFHGSKTNVELNFATGEAVSVFACGWDAVVLSRKMDIEKGEVPEGKLVSRQAGQNTMLESVLNDILQMREKTSGISARKGACVWLLSLVEFCGHLAPVQDRLPSIHNAFRAYLNDRDDFVQETAARGLTVVYERGDDKLKEDLVRNLIQSFTSSTRVLAGSVQADTQLFNEGQLPTGDGSLSTYKDIMGLAAEVGDPGLIYKFMSLASHSAMWSSRAAVGRFGLGKIMSSDDTLLAANPKLYPALFRYRFDPNPNVQRSMEDIWSALVKDQAATIDEHFDDIIKDLLQTILGKEWRTREASCGAIADLIQGRPLVKYEKYLEDIWKKAFLVLDDIKTSVREAALKLCRALTATMVRNVSAESGSSAEDARTVLKHLMPFLLGPNGLEAQAQEVQAFALETLMKIVEGSGPSIRSHIPDIVEHLLSIMSSLEPQAINYLHLNAEKYKLTEAKIDAARLSNVRASPIMTTIESCLDQADRGTFNLLIPRLAIIIKKLIGLPSKVGASRVIVTLVLRHSLIKPHANLLLQAVSSVLLDINETVAASYATAAGYLCRLADTAAILRLVHMCSNLFFSHEDDRTRGLAGTIIYAISKHASDNFLACAVDVLPLCFVARHDSSEDVRADFEKAWTENTGTGSVKLYCTEIVSMASAHLSSQRWSVKETSALSIAAACTSIGAEVSEHQVALLWPVIKEALGGKTWDGKEKVLDAYVTLAINAPNTFMGTGDHLEELKKTILREASRRNFKYKVHALGSLARFAESFDSLDICETSYTLAKEVLEEENEDLEEDQNGMLKASKLWQLTFGNAVLVLTQSYRQANKKEAGVRIDRIIRLIETQLPQLNYETKLSTVRGLDILLNKIKKSSPSYLKHDNAESTVAFKRLWKLLSTFVTEQNHELVRVRAADTTGTLVSVLSDNSFNSVVEEVAKDVSQFVQDKSIATNELRQLHSKIVSLATQITS